MRELAAVEPAETIFGRRVLLLTLTLCSSLGMVASTIYVPSLPAIAVALDTSVAQVQFTFVGYLLAFAVSMLVIGPLSDRCGRKQTLICGLALCALASIVCAQLVRLSISSSLRGSYKGSAPAPVWSWAVQLLAIYGPATRPRKLWPDERLPPP
jgi:DHA1 family bicyclomycin/chloramphenicol resistance-like MFS transporter